MGRCRVSFANPLRSWLLSFPLQRWSIVAHSVGQVYIELKRQLGYAIVVVLGSIAGSFFGRHGVAVGVSIAIVCMFIATGQLALQITRASWTDYLHAEWGVILITTVFALFAIAARVALERIHARAASITAGILAAAALPQGVGLMWYLGEPDLAHLGYQLPPEVCDLIHFIRRISTSTASFRG